MREHLTMISYVCYGKKDNFESIMLGLSCVRSCLELVNGLIPSQCIYLFVYIPSKYYPPSIVCVSKSEECVCLCTLSFLEMLPLIFCLEAHVGLDACPNTIPSLREWSHTLIYFRLALSSLAPVVWWIDRNCLNTQLYTVKVAFSCCWHEGLCYEGLELKIPQAFLHLSL